MSEIMRHYKYVTFTNWHKWNAMRNGTYYGAYATEEQAVEAILEAFPGLTREEMKLSEPVPARQPRKDKMQPPKKGSPSTGYTTEITWATKQGNRTQFVAYQESKQWVDRQTARLIEDWRDKPNAPFRIRTRLVTREQWYTDNYGGVPVSETQIVKHQLHRFHLREDVEVYFELPEDMTQKEADRLAAAVKTFAMEKVA